MTRKTILLFDIDGVLLDPQGYRLALRDALDHIAARMGAGPVDLHDEEIAYFESRGMTNEWCSGPSFSAALLVETLREYPDLAASTFWASVDSIRAAGLPLPRPDFTAPMRAVVQEGELLHETGPLLAWFRQTSPQALHPALEDLLADVYHPDSPFTALFQQFTLGSEGYARTYSRPADLALPGYLLTKDRPNLHPETRAALLASVNSGRLAACLFTARPSLPARDLPTAVRNGLDPARFPPEADYGAQCIDLEALPLIASGRLTWLALRRGQHPNALTKPAPFHALAAAAAALTGSEYAGLLAADALLQRGELSGPFAAKPALHLVVFEDAAGGIRATAAAADLLAQAGLDISWEAVGVSHEAEKQASLSRLAQRVVADVNDGLWPYLE